MWCIAQGENVTLLSPPPPERFHPSGLSYYQLIEEPIIRGLIDKKSVQKIMIVPPMIKKSDDLFYELWPNDERDKWVEKFGSSPYKRKWREVRHGANITLLKSLVALSEQPVHSMKVKQHEQNEVSNSKSFVISSESSLMILPRLPSSILLMLFYYY